MANQTLQKLASDAGKTYAAWQAQMRRDGYTKREQLSADNADRNKMSPAARALWDDYVEAQEKLNEESKTASQPKLFGGGHGGPEGSPPDGGGGGGGTTPPTQPPSDPPSKPAAAKGKGKAKKEDNLPDPNADRTPASPDGLTPFAVADDRYSEFQGMIALKDLAAAKPKVKALASLDGTDYAVLAEDESGLVLVPVYPESVWDKPKLVSLNNAPEVEGGVREFGGLQFTKGKDRYVLGMSTERIRVVKGDPLAHVDVPTEEPAAPVETPAPQGDGDFDADDDDNKGGELAAV